MPAHVNPSGLRATSPSQPTVRAPTSPFAGAPPRGGALGSAPRFSSKGHAIRPQRTIHLQARPTRPLDQLAHLAHSRPSRSRRADVRAHARSGGSGGAARRANERDGSRSLTDLRARNSKRGRTRVLMVHCGRRSFLRESGCETIRASGIYRYNTDSTCHCPDGERNERPRRITRQS